MPKTLGSSADDRIRACRRALVLDLATRHGPFWLTIDSLRRRQDGFVVFDEGRARLNDAPGYQVRHRSGPADAPRFGHDVLLVSEPPVGAPGLLVSMVQHNDAVKLGPGDRGLVFEAKRAFRSLRFGNERP